jgi:hypothetical protein
MSDANSECLLLMHCERGVQPPVALRQVLAETSPRSAYKMSIGSPKYGEYGETLVRD